MQPYPAFMQGMEIFNEDMEDDFILSQLRKGDEAAFKYIFDRHYEYCCRFANQILHDVSLSEEIVDDVIFYLWEHHDDLAEIYSLRSYLSRAVRNRCLNEINSAHNRNERRLNDVTPAESLNFLESVFRDDDNPLDGLLFSELERKIDACIEELPKECKTVFVKSRYEHKKQDEIARELHISVNTVKYHIKNALAFLRRRMKNYLYYAFLYLIFQV